jgi:hypothetical protein
MAAACDLEAVSPHRPRPLESVSGEVLRTNLAAAAAALSQMDAQLQRQQTDNISLGAGLSAVPGELDDAVLNALAGSTSTATAAPAAAQQGAGVGGSDTSTVDQGVCAADQQQQQLGSSKGVPATGVVQPDAMHRLDTDAGYFMPYGYA